MDIEQSKAILASLSPEVLAERQRIVDVAVRAARGSGYCDTFNEMIHRVMPEMVIHLNGYPYAFNTDGITCSGATLAQVLRDSGQGPRVFGPDGYDTAGFDRDGFNRAAYDKDGYDADGFTASFGRERFGYYRKAERGADGQRLYARRLSESDPIYDEERMFRTGYGQYTNLDPAGNPRPARPATPEEAAEEAAGPVAFNPTTWTPATVTVG